MNFNFRITILSLTLLAVMMVPYSASAQSAPKTKNTTDEAIFAGGCFWCMEQAFEDIDGVLSAVSGYIDGDKENPSYKSVSAGGTGHTEAVKVTFDTTKTSFEKLLPHFWKNIDPTVKDKQFCDVGTQYRSGIYFLNETQEKLSKASLTKVKSLFKNVYTEVKPAKTFYPAEAYHQDYYKKNPIRYKAYKYNCGRASRLEKIWKQKDLP